MFHDHPLSAQVVRIRYEEDTPDGCREHNTSSSLNEARLLHSCSSDNTGHRYYMSEQWIHCTAEKTEYIGFQEKASTQKDTKATISRVSSQKSSPLLLTRQT